VIEYDRLIERKVPLCAHTVAKKLPTLTKMNRMHRQSLLLVSVLQLFWHVILACGFFTLMCQIPSRAPLTMIPRQTYLCCFLECLLWFESRHPGKYARLRRQYHDTPARDFAMLIQMPVANGNMLRSKKSRSLYLDSFPTVLTLACAVEDVLKAES